MNGLTEENTVNGVELRCARCLKYPSQIAEYRFAALSGKTSPAEYVWYEEGTLDRITGKFLCDDCYIAKGMPVEPWGWKATPANLRALGL